MSKKGENIRKRKDGRWEGRYKKSIKASGAPLYGSVYGSSYSEVKQKLYAAFAMATTKGQALLSEEGILFSELLNRWQNNNEVRLKRGTKAKYANLIDSHIAPCLGHIKVSNITASIINEFLAERLKSGRVDGSGGLSASYVRSISVVISSALKFAVEEGLCLPMKNKIHKPSIKKSSLSILCLEEQRIVEDFAINRLTPIGVGVMISLYTGLRIGEICALMWEDIDFAANVLFVKRTVSRVSAKNGARKTELVLDTPKTSASARAVPLPSPLVPLLLKYRAISTSKFVVSDKEGFISPRTYEARYHKLLASCNVSDLNYHALRHTFATRCIEAGVDIKSLSEILGHSKVSITLDTYVHTSLEMKKCQIEKLATFINNTQ